MCAKNPVDAFLLTHTRLYVQKASSFKASTFFLSKKAAIATKDHIHTQRMLATPLNYPGAPKKWLLEDAVQLTGGRGVACFTLVCSDDEMTLVIRTRPRNKRHLRE